MNPYQKLYIYMHIINPECYDISSSAHVHNGIVKPLEHPEKFLQVHQRNAFF